MFLNILFGFISFLFIVASAYLATRVLYRGQLLYELLLFVFLSIFITTALMLTAGLLGILRPLWLGIISLAGLFFYAAVPVTRQELSNLKQESKRLCSAVNQLWVSLPNWMKWLSTIFIIVSLFRFFFLIWALPPFIWDSMTYHLTNVAQWTQDGRIAVFDVPVVRTYSPANFEVFSTWFTIFLHHDIVVEAAGLPAYLLAGLSVYAIARALEISKWASLLGVIAYLSTPALLLAVTGTKNDPIMAAFYLMAVALIIDLLSGKEATERPGYAGKMLGLILVLLLALGTKPYMLHLSSGLLVIGVGFSYRSKQSLRGIWASIRRFLSGSRYSRIVLAVLLISGLFLGTYWYVRNWSLTGNPFYPYGISVGDTSVVEKETSNVPFDLENLWRNLRLFSEKFGDKQNRILPDLPNTTGWGWIVYGMGIPALVWSVIRKKRMCILAAGFLVSFLAILISNRASPWNMRYVVWFPALMSLALAAAFDWFPEEFRTAKRGLSFLFISLLALNMVMTLTYNLIPIRTFQEMLSRSAWERDAALLDVYLPEEYSNALDIVGLDERLGYNVHSNGFIYPLYRSDYSQDLVYVPFSPDDSCVDVANEMRLRGTRYLMVAPVHSEDEIISLLQRCANAGDVIRERGINLYVIESSND